MDLSKIINVLFNDSESTNKPNTPDKYKSNKSNKCNDNDNDEYIDLELGNPNKTNYSHIPIYHKDEYSYKPTYGYFVTHYNFKYNNK